MISIIIPVFNCEKKIERVFSSLINSTYKNVEIIFIDDGSVDNTSKLIKQFMSNNKLLKIKYYYQKNSGVSSARNLGISKASGDYFYFLDSDDEFNSSMLQQMVKAIKKEKCDFVITNFYFSSLKNKKEKIGYNLNLTQGSYILDNISKEKILKRIINGSMSTFVWTYLIKKSSVIEFNEKLDFMEDRLFIIKLFINSTCFYYLNDSNYYYYYNNEKKSNVYWKRYLKNFNILYNDTETIIQENFPQLINEFKLNFFKQYNYILYVIFCTSSINDVKKNTLKNFDNRYNDIKPNNFSNKYHRICFYLLYKRKYKLLSLIYTIKRMCKK